DQNHVDRFRGLGNVEDRIGQPIDADDVFVIEPDFFPKRAADRLHDIAFDRVQQSIRIDDLAAIVRDRELARPDLTAGPIDFDFGYDGDAGRMTLHIGEPASRNLIAALVLAW